MKKHLLLVTGPLDESQVPQFLAALRRAAGSVRIQEVGGRRAKEQRPLTPRQLQVLRAIASGNTVGEIAAFLKISRKTVETHRQKIIERLGTRRVADLVRYSLRHGIVPATWLLKL